ncbi:MAG: HEAT repeat domain-containing protein [Chloroflexi bacterium]|nr:HEAT repeat domain-containing protein [Chloroflexota bacterium]
MQRIAESSDKIKRVDLQVLSNPDARSIAEFKTEWPKLPPERKRVLIQAMEDAAEETVQSEFSDLLLTLLDEPDDIVRAAVVRGLWEVDTPSFGKRLLTMAARDTSAPVRAAAAAGLGEYLMEAEENERSIPQSKPITDCLLARFHDPNEDLEVRRRALESVAYSGDERAHSAIQEAYDEGDSDMRESSLYAMGRSGDTSWTPIVIRELKNPAASLRYEAAIAAGELSASDALAQLIKMVQDPDGQVRESAVWALGQIGGREARRVLEAVLESDDEELQEAAEDALAELEFIEGIDNLNMFDFEIATLDGLVDDDLDDDELDDDDDAPDIAPRTPRPN